MKSVKVYHYDAFTTEPDKGNPAGIVLTGDSLTEAEMQEIAKQVGFNETVFPIRSDAADLRLRYFTPGHEINLCGHGTMASIFALKSRGVLADKIDLTIETKAGILPVSIRTGDDGALAITMRQAEPQFVPFNGSRDALASSLGLTAEDLDDTLPIVYGSTGTWTLLVPIKHLEAFRRMQPDNPRFPSVLTEMPRASVHPICLETYDPAAQMHARHFSSPYSGTIEDPATGTAAGVMGAYYLDHIAAQKAGPLQLLIEQGQEIGRNGRIGVQICPNGESCTVEVSGTAVYVKEFDLSMETL